MVRTRGEALSSPHTVESPCPFPSGPVAGPQSPMAAAAPTDPAQVNARLPAPQRRPPTQTRKARRGASARVPAAQAPVSGTGRRRRAGARV